MSIVIPFYNRVSFLLETINSVLAQTYRDFELLLIDDGTVQQEREALDEYLMTMGDNRILVYDRPIHIKKGANGCRKFGLLLARGSYIKWFDSDDLMCPDLLREQVHNIGNGYDGVFCSCEVWNEDFSKLISTRWRAKEFSSSPVIDYLKSQLAWPTCCGIWRKDTLHHLNPFGEDIKNSQEWMFHLKILCGGLKIGVSSASLVKIRNHENSISGKKNVQYFINRFKARGLALLLLVETRNPGKGYIVKSLYNMFVNQMLYKEQVIYSLIVLTLLKIPGKFLFSRKVQSKLELIKQA